jgi:RNA polymerase sigma factor (sigma-70 family)
MLLEAIRLDDSPRAWEELDARCRPIMLGVARRVGLGDALAADASQAAMISLVEAIRTQQFDRSRGSLRALCLVIVRSKAVDLWRKRVRAKEARGDSAMGMVEAAGRQSLERFWMDERRDQILRHAMQELREGGTDERTIRAFEMFGLRDMDPVEVGKALGMSRDEVYLAKFRVAKRLRPIVARLDEIYEDL